MPPSSFYDNLPVCDAFNHVCDDSYYRRAPSDWLVVVSDVVNSTSAITTGHYKDVNTVGAACIAAVQNALGGADVAYVFGGDGASLVIAPDQRERVANALLGTKQLATQRFGLELRIGAVPISDLEEAGATQPGA